MLERTTHVNIWAQQNHHGQVMEIFLEMDAFTGRLVDSNDQLGQPALTESICGVDAEVVKD
ncbi:hypothetical protein Tco_1534928, partial [Tanacetum coccineum]